MLTITNHNCGRSPFEDWLAVAMPNAKAGLQMHLLHLIPSSLVIIMSSSNHVKNVAIIGVSLIFPHLLPLIKYTDSKQGRGNLGSYIITQLLKTGKHTATAITRE
ncbi:hypothetical protein K470DRAFT_143094 [Piedraia hortae CBS 480.64]|uniref:Uncharacterized protein n=1 Tax=Piedraia hortae CBS 480.64 TaxID=1314780 RepID=A0A6A7C9D6_9PEZI|nr:hypothetical protein K470DRAFT_143094 [Piedraia hortae CBS 480.64]